MNDTIYHILILPIIIKDEKNKRLEGRIKTMVKKSKNEICELIGVKPGGLKSIEHRGKLIDRLLSVGFNARLSR